MSQDVEPRWSQDREGRSQEWEFSPTWSSQGNSWWLRNPLASWGSLRAPLPVPYKLSHAGKAAEKQAGCRSESQNKEKNKKKRTKSEPGQLNSAWSAAL